MRLRAWLLCTGVAVAMANACGLNPQPELPSDNPGSKVDAGAGGTGGFTPGSGGGQTSGSGATGTNLAAGAGGGAGGKNYFDGAVPRTEGGDGGPDVTDAQSDAITTDALDDGARRDGVSDALGDAAGGSRE